MSLIEDLQHLVDAQSRAAVLADAVDAYGDLDRAVTDYVAGRDPWRDALSAIVRLSDLVEDGALVITEYPAGLPSLDEIVAGLLSVEIVSAPVARDLAKYDESGRHADWFINGPLES